MFDAQFPHPKLTENGYVETVQIILTYISILTNEI